MSRPRPIFVIGGLRSGTTLLRYLLNSHPRLACPPESKVIAAVAGALAQPQVLPALMSLNFTSEDIFKRFRGTVESFLNDYAKAAGKPRWVEKTPGCSYFLPYIDRIFEEEPQYVLLARHPLDCICSLEDLDARFPSFRQEDPDIYTLMSQFGSGRHIWARYWSDTYERIYGFWQCVPARCHLVFYEELVTQPAAILSQVLNFLGEDPALLALDTAFLALNRNGYQDDKILKTTQVHTNSIGTRRRLCNEDARKMWDLVRQTALKFNYTK